MNSKFKKLICVCGVMILIGIVMTVAGIASGGATDGLKKVDERYDFISMGYDHLNQETYNLSDIKSIDINYAYCDIRFVEGDSFRVDVTYTDDMPTPDVTTANGTLSITEGNSGKTGSLLNMEMFGARTRWPEILVTCPRDAKLDSVSINSDYSSVILSGTVSSKTDIRSESGDITLNGTQPGELSVTSVSGDITLHNLNTTGLNINSDNGDVVLSGTFAGNNVISSQNGDVEMDSAISMEEYTINIDGFYDLEVNGSDFDYDDNIMSGIYEYVGQKAINSLTINGGGIDAELRFAY